MKKFSKSVVATFASMALLLMPTQAIFAEEFQEYNKNISPQAIVSGTVGGHTTDIYFNGSVTVGVTPTYVGGIFDVYSQSPDGNFEYLGEIRGSGTLQTKLYGYYKIYVTSTNSSGTFYVNF
jgi:hypothetical protein